MASPSALVKTGLKPLPRLEEAEVAEAPLTEDSARVADPVGPSGAVARSTVSQGGPLRVPCSGYISGGEMKRRP